MIYKARITWMDVDGIPRNTTMMRDGETQDEALASMKHTLEMDSGIIAYKFPFDPKIYRKGVDYAKV